MRRAFQVMELISSEADLPGVNACHDIAGRFANGETVDQIRADTNWNKDDIKLMRIVSHLSGGPQFGFGVLPVPSMLLVEPESDIDPTNVFAGRFTDADVPIFDISPVYFHHNGSQPAMREVMRRQAAYSRIEARI
jgi:hypothetical protein